MVRDGPCRSGMFHSTGHGYMYRVKTQYLQLFSRFDTHTLYSTMVVSSIGNEIKLVIRFNSLVYYILSRIISLALKYNSLHRNITHVFTLTNESWLEWWFKNARTWQISVSHMKKDCFLSLFCVMCFLELITNS